MDAVIRRKEHIRMRKSAASTNQADFAEGIEGNFSSIKGDSMSFPCMILGVPEELGGRGGNAYDEMIKLTSEQDPVVIHLEAIGSTSWSTYSHRYRVLRPLIMNTYLRFIERARDSNPT